MKQRQRARFWRYLTLLMQLAVVLDVQAEGMPGEEGSADSFLQRHGNSGAALVLTLVYIKYDQERDTLHFRPPHTEKTTLPPDVVVPKDAIRSIQELNRLNIEGLGYPLVRVTFDRGRLSPLERALVQQVGRQLPPFDRERGQRFGIVEPMQFLYYCCEKGVDPYPGHTPPGCKVIIMPVLGAGRCAISDKIVWRCRHTSFGSHCSELDEIDICGVTSP